MILFTGIIEEIGTVKNIFRGRNSAVLTIATSHILDGTRLGDSIAVNGICLTVTKLSSDCFSADVMHETMNRSSLSNLAIGQKVNLERAMPANGRFGGHIVSGHVDGVGTITGIRQDDTAVWYTIQAEPEIMRYIVEKGSIAVDGISLTVAKVEQTAFSVSMIPHTVRYTVMQERKQGDIVNLECDIIGKYVGKLMGVASQKEESRITKNFLEYYGF